MNIEWSHHYPQESQELENFLVTQHPDAEATRTYTAQEIKRAGDKNARMNFIVGKSEGRIVCAGCLSEEAFSYEVWGISWIRVHQDFRRQGLGQKTVEKCLEEISRRAGTTVTVLLNTYPNQTTLYERCGFEIMGLDHEGGAFMKKIVRV